MRILDFFRDDTMFYAKLRRLVLPLAFQQFMLAAVSASDALMLGVLSQDSLSAVSLAGQITFIFNLFMGGFTTGTSILAAQYYGKGDQVSLEKIFAYVLRISALVSAMFCLAALFLPQQLIRLFTSDPGRRRLSACSSRFVSVYQHLSDIPVYAQKYRGSDTEHDNQFYGGRTEYYT